MSTLIAKPVRVILNLRLVLRCPKNEVKGLFSMAARNGPNALLTLAEVCDELRVARSAFNDWRAKKCAPRCVRLPNRQLRFRRSELDDWIASREAAVA